MKTCSPPVRIVCSSFESFPIAIHQICVFTFSSNDISSSIERLPMDHTEHDSRVQRACKAMRANWFPSIQPTMSERQALSRQEAPFKGKLRTSQTVYSISSDEDLRGIFLQAVLDLDNTLGETKGFTLEEKIRSIRSEWNGYRVSKTEEVSELSEQEKYYALRQDCSSDTTILYAHGGGYWSVLYSVFEEIVLSSLV